MSTTQVERPAAQTPVTAETGAEVRNAPESAPKQRPYRIRRQFLVSPAEQLRSGLMTTLIVAGLLLMLNVALLQTTRMTTAAITDDTPALAASLMSADRTRAAVTLGCSIVFLLGFGVLRVLETHRTYGAALNIRARLDEMASGNFRARVRLRRHDHLHDVAQSVNSVALSIEEREREECVRLESLVKLASAADAAGRVNEISRELEHLIESKRENAG